jgi:hypothetical protein
MRRCSGSAATSIRLTGPRLDSDVRSQAPLHQLPVPQRCRLGEARIRDIVGAPAFQCHKTVDYSGDDKPRAGDRPQQCAGLIAVLHRSDRDNQITQVAERLLGYDPGQVDPRGEAYDSLDQALRAHRDGIEP